MPATVTLATTTLAAPACVSDTRILLASTAGIPIGTNLFLDGELVIVTGLDVDPWVKVRRGAESTPAVVHAAGVTVYIGRGDQFYGQDPVGRPHSVIPVSPYINVTNGSIWFAQGDANGSSNRWWQKATLTYVQGLLGVRNSVIDPSVST